jgi:hypothetical protein
VRGGIDPGNGNNGIWSMLPVVFLWVDHQTGFRALQALASNALRFCRLASVSGGDGDQLGASPRNSHQYSFVAFFSPYVQHFEAVGFI